MQIKKITYLALLIPIILIGCCSSKCGKLKEFQISWGEGGGATGRWTGYTIDSKTKEISKWSAMIQEQNPSHLKKICKSDLKKIFEEIELKDLVNTNYQEPANMSHYFKITSSGKSNVILWNPNLQNELTTKLNKFYDFLNKYTN
jgi:hypothetical protein